MSPITTPSLVAAVSNTGGMGSLAAARMTPNQLRDAIRDIRQLTSKPFAVNLFVPRASDNSSKGDQSVVQSMVDSIREEMALPPIQSQSPPPPALPDFASQFAVIAEEKVPVFSWTFGIADSAVLSECRARGIQTMGTATTAVEAAMLVSAGVDGVVAQGSEAGGHRGTFTYSDRDIIEHATIGLFSLLTQIRAMKICHDHTPVIAAGGVMDGTGLVASMLLGASAAQCGTLFLTAHETRVSQEHRKLLLAPSVVRHWSGDNDHASASASVDIERLRAVLPSTVLTRAFTGKPARGFSNEMTRRMKSIEDHLLPWGEQARLVAPVAAAAAAQGNAAYQQLWVGQSYPLCEDKSAASLVDKLIDEASQVLGVV